MKAPKNRRVFVIGYGAATPLGRNFPDTWERAVKGEAGFRKVTRCQVKSARSIVGEIPEWDPYAYDFSDEKEVYNWNAAIVILTMAVCKEAAENAGLQINGETGPKTACLIGSALNGTDAFRIAAENLRDKGPLRVSPYLLPNLCANLPSGKAGILMGFTGQIFSPQAACASGNYAIALGSRMIRDGDCDFVLAGGVDMPIMPVIIHGFANMNATIKVLPGDRAYTDPARASRPFSIDRRGFVLSEGAGVIVLAAEEMLARLDKEVAAWNKADPEHVAAVHGGRGDARQATAVVHVAARQRLEAVRAGRCGRGRGREGGTEMLKMLGREMGFEVEQVPSYASGSVVVSSTVIRKAVMAGDVGRAGELLRRPFALSGRVIHGERRGRSLGFPTANLEVGPEQLLPADGVYATRTRLGGKTYRSVTSIGKKPTFGNEQRVVEVHLLGFSDEVYEKKLIVEFVKRLRDQKRFDSADALVAQIRRDVDEAEEALGSASGR